MHVHGYDMPFSNMMDLPRMGGEPDLQDSPPMQTRKPHTHNRFLGGGGRAGAKKSGGLEYQGRRHFLCAMRPIRVG